MVKQDYGEARETWVEMQDAAHVVMQGTLAEAQVFKQILTLRAARYLWHFLTRALFPSQGRDLTALGNTAVLHMPDDPTLTTHVGVVDLPDEEYAILGTMSKGDAWEIKISRNEAHRLWGILDLLLYPVGWEGREQNEL